MKALVHLRFEWSSLTRERQASDCVLKDRKTKKYSHACFKEARALMRLGLRTGVKRRDRYCHETSNPKDVSLTSSCHDRDPSRRSGFQKATKQTLRLRSKLVCLVLEHQHQNAAVGIEGSAGSCLGLLQRIGRRHVSALGDQPGSGKRAIDVFALAVDGGVDPVGNFVVALVALKADVLVASVHHRRPPSHP